MDLNLPKLPVQANHAHVLPHLSESLFSVPKLTKCGVDALFTGNKTCFLEKGIKISQGEMKNNLCYVNLQPSKEKINNLSNISSKKDLIEYFHQSMFGPTKDTFLKACKKGFSRSFPGLTEELTKNI